MADVRAERRLRLRFSKRYGNRRAGKHREGQLARDLHHAPGFGPTIRQMPVIEDRNGAACLAENVCDFAEELESWIQLLALFVGRIIAVLSNEQNTIDGQAAVSQGERLFNGRED